jgi:hypothetical protein
MLSSCTGIGSIHAAFELGHRIGFEIAEEIALAELQNVVAAVGITPWGRLQRGEDNSASLPWLELGMQNNNKQSRTHPHSEFESAQSSG